MLEAVRNGRSRAISEQEGLFPVIGVSGIVDLVIQGRFPKKNSRWAKRNIVRRLFEILRALQPVLARGVESYWLAHHRRYFAYIEQKINKVTLRPSERRPSLVFNDVGCAVIAVLIRHDKKVNHGTWIPLFVHIDHDRSNPLSSVTNTSLLEQQNSSRLDDIALSPSAKGLALSPEQGKQLFPSFFPMA